jgi:hypothetical protein
MRMIGTALQLAGLGTFVAGGVLEYGLAGGLVGGGLSAVYVGLAMDRG